MSSLFTKQFIPVALAPFLFVTCLVTTAHATSFRLSILAQTGDTIGGKTITGIRDRIKPSLNNNGEVAFTADFSGGAGIFTQNSLLAQTGDTIGGKTLTDFFPRDSPRKGISLNDNGEASFLADFSGGDGIFTQNALLAQTGGTIGGKTLIGFPAKFPSLNNNGEAAFVADFSGGGGILSEGVFTQNALLAQTGDTIGGKTLTGIDSGGTVGLNDNGEVAFTGFFSGSQGIFTQDALLAQNGDTIGGKVLENVGGPSLNDNCEVAFRGGFSGGDGIFTQTALLAQSGDTIGGKTLANVGRFSLNDSCEVAFRASFIEGLGRSLGIFTPDTLLAQAGDTIGGKTLRSITFPSLNNNGEVVFIGSFEDGSEGVILAQPVPTPNTLFLLIAGLVGWKAAWLWKTRKHT